MIDMQKLEPKAVKVVNHDRQLCVLRYSPDGKMLLGGGFDARVRRWDATSDELKELPPLAGHDGWVSSLVVAGERVISADSWGQIRCTPSAGQAPQPLWAVKEAHDGWARQLALSPDGKTVASCGRDGVVRLWSVEKGQKLQELAGHNEDVYSVAFHPGGKTLVSGDLKGKVKQWDLASGKATRELDAGVLFVASRLQDVGGVRCLVFDAAGSTLAVAGGQPKSGASVQATPMVLLFDWASGKKQSQTALGVVNDGFVFDLTFHPGGFLVVATSGQPGNGKLYLLRPGEAQPFFTTNKMANCHSIALHPGGKRFVVAATNAGSNGNGRRLDKNMEYAGNFSPLHIWDIPTA